MLKRIIITSGIFLFSVFSSLAQKKELDPTNMREGENVEYCVTHKKMNELRNNKDFMKSYALNALQHEKALKKVSSEKAVVYKIPIVFHVLHNNGIENISDEQIHDQLAILNRDFDLQNADASLVQSDFQGMPADIDVEFVLATKAPNGQCFKGITRTANVLTFDGSNGYDQVGAIVSGNDVFNGQWPGDKYLNVFIVAEADGAAGYTMTPLPWLASSMANGIWILHGYVGSIGTSSITTSRALTHEVGHWLNLEHTWGPNNNPGNAASCGSDDEVEDTPNCIGVTSCSLFANTCNSINSYWSYDVKDNVENYMDYSYCSKMFTQGQADRMRAALNVSETGRSNLWQTSNLIQTGADGIIYLCNADFTSDKTIICLGDSVQFYDGSYNVVNGWNWTFQSGTPATSTDQNPVVTYNSPGLYAVTLTASDGSSSVTETKTSYIRVLQPSSSLPFYDGFENYTTLSGINNWQVYNANNNNTFILDNTVSHSGSKCVKLTNFNQSGSNSDELIAAPVDLSGVADQGGVVTLSFRYAYRKRTANDMEFLKIFVTSDCGDTWIQRKTMSGSQLSPTAVSTSWSPTSPTDWITAHVINITSDYWVDNMRYKFEFEGNNGNNFYLDDINIYLGNPSESIVVGIDKQSPLEDMHIFPNPSDDELNINFSLNASEETMLEIRDVTGKTILKYSINGEQGSNIAMLNTGNMAAGTYFLTLTAGASEKVMQFVVK